MSFLEIVLPEDISYGSEIGPEWLTDVVELRSGHEQRNQVWSHPRYSGDLAYGIIAQDDEGNGLASLQSLTRFWKSVRGITYGFRVKDPSDYQATDEAQSPDGSPTLQLYKRYEEDTGANPYDRPITKVVAGTDSLERNNVIFAAYSLDTTTGILTFTADWSGTISNITQANPGVVTVTGHGRTTGNVLYLEDVGGMTELNGEPVTITVIDADTFSIGVDTTAYSAYTSGGTAAKYVQPNDTLTATFEFHIPMRFVNQKLSKVLSHYQSGQVQVPVIEVRV